MHIPYRYLSEYPAGRYRQAASRIASYKALIEKRTHPIDALIAKFGRIPDELLTPRACPTCGATAEQPELSKDHMAVVPLWRVRSGVRQSDLRRGALPRAYASAEYQEIVRDLGISSHEYRVGRFGNERVTLMEARVRHRGEQLVRYLDVGCSTGFVVEAARDRGWDATGIDLNPSAVEFGRARGLDLRTVALDHAGFAAGSFDAISLFDVLEHLLAPAATLRSCINLLARGGILFLYVPNYDSASRLLMGAAAHFIWPTHHLNYYTPATLTDLMARHGLATGVRRYRRSRYPGLHLVSPRGVGQGV